MKLSLTFRVVGLQSPETTKTAQACRRFYCYYFLFLEDAHVSRRSTTRCNDITYVRERARVCVKNRS